MADTHKTIIRIPKDLHEKIKQAAEEEERSVNRQIVKILKDWAAAEYEEEEPEDEEGDEWLE